MVFKAHHKPLPLLPMGTPPHKSKEQWTTTVNQETSVLAEKKNTPSDCVELTAKLLKKKIKIGSTGIPK